MSFKITTTKEDLAKALLATEKVAVKHLSLPVLQCVFLKVSGGVTLMRATNLEIGVEVSLRTSVSSDGDVAVPAALFSQTVQFIPPGAEVTLESDGSLLTVRAAGSKTAIKTLSSDDFPELPRLDEGQKATVRAAELLEVLRAVSYSASNSSVKPELASIFLSLSGQTLTAAATDSFRLAEKKVPVKKAGSLGPILIPSRQASDLMRLAELLGDELELCANEHQLSLSGKAGYVTTRLVEGSFPDYTQVIPNTFTASATVLKQDMLLALRKAAVFSDKFRQVTLTLSPAKKLFAISSSQSDIGETREEVGGSFEGDELSLSFNERYLTECFQSIAAESLSLSFAGPARPLVIRGLSDNSFLYLAMPMNR